MGVKFGSIGGERGDFLILNVAPGRRDFRISATARRFARRFGPIGQIGETRPRPRDAPLCARDSDPCARRTQNSYIARVTIGISRFVREFLGIGMVSIGSSTRNYLG